MCQSISRSSLGVHDGETPTKKTSRVLGAGEEVWRLPWSKIKHHAQMSKLHEREKRHEKYGTTVECFLKRKRKVEGRGRGRERL